MKAENIRIDRSTVLKVIFALWVFVWFLFLVRGLSKGELAEYRALLGKNLEEKRAYVTGREFYEFIWFCNHSIPENADYKLVARYDDSMDYYRFAYYAYPRLRNLYSPEYIICYKSRFEKRGYKKIAQLNREKYILKRESKR